MITQKQFEENATPTIPDAKLRKGDVISSVCECKHPLYVAGDSLLEKYCGKCYKDIKAN